MQKTCRQCQISFDATDDDLAFLERLTPVVLGHRFPLPPPTFCPECRQQRRLAFRNDQHYYRHTCVLCKKPLISIYSPDKKIPVLCDACFWSDRFDPLVYGRPIDLHQPFLGQFQEMRTSVPRLAIYHTQSENSEYTVHSSRNRNCYMSSSLVDDEEVHYSDFTFESRDCMDLFSCGRMELCYECLFCEACYGSDFCELCTDIRDCTLCFDCKGTSDCVGCVGFRNRSHCILNAEAPPEECRTTAQKLRSDPAFREKFQVAFAALKLQIPVRDAWMVGSENCTGNYILHSKNVQFGYNVKHFEDVHFGYDGHKDTDCCDIMRCASCETLYDCTGAVDLRFSAFCNLCYQCDNMFYCDNCQGSSNCFGCMALKKHRFCILNRQYAQEEYAELVPQVVVHMQQEHTWGEFFPATLSPFGYNETKAYEWYPLTEREVRLCDWEWSHYAAPLPEGLQMMAANALPSDITEVGDDILSVAIVCEGTGQPFRVMPQELAFYRKKGLPLPPRSSQQRHCDRVARQNSRKLWSRTCMKCSKTIQTTYSPDRPEIVYCERCYLQTVY